MSDDGGTMIVLREGRTRGVRDALRGIKGRSGIIVSV
jgi:hypothetical protein